MYINIMKWGGIFFLNKVDRTEVQTIREGKKPKQPKQPSDSGQRREIFTLISKKENCILVGFSSGFLCSPAWDRQDSKF